MIRSTAVARRTRRIDLPEFGLGLKQVTKQSFTLGKVSREIGKTIFNCVSEFECVYV